MEYFTIISCSILFSAAIGAYFGTADYRIRNDQKLMSADCFCPSCHHRLPLRQQIPVISWLLLRGRCAYCGSPISVRYPLIEAGFILYDTAVLWIFFRTPAAIPFLWFGLVVIVLLLRSAGHFRSMLRGLAIFAVFHALYGTLLFAILSSLQGA